MLGRVGKTFLKISSVRGVPPLPPLRTEIKKKIHPKILFLDQFFYGLGGYPPPPFKDFFGKGKEVYGFRGYPPFKTNSIKSFLTPSLTFIVTLNSIHKSYDVKDMA